MSKPTPTTTLLVIALTSLVACTADEQSETPASPDASLPVEADASPNADASASAEPSVPTDAAELFAFLQRRDYSSFTAEASVHPSSGPHQRVRSFFNASLAESMAQGASRHPIGAATIKELYSGNELSGWAAMVKVDERGLASDWYFYEIFSVTNGANPVADEVGHSGCAGCHASGTDYIRSSLP